MGLWLTKSGPCLSQNWPPVVEKAPFWELGDLDPLHNSLMAWLCTFEGVRWLSEGCNVPIGGRPAMGPGEAWHLEHKIRASNPHFTQ